MILKLFTKSKIPKHIYNHKIIKIILKKQYLSQIVLKVKESKMNKKIHNQIKLKKYFIFQEFWLRSRQTPYTVKTYKNLLS
jgi:hypothetical protein